MDHIDFQQFLMAIARGLDLQFKIDYPITLCLTTYSHLLITVQFWIISLYQLQQ